MKLRNKAFTLVELLAVIVILAIILTIAVPSIANIIDEATRNTFESNTKLILRAVDYKLAQDPTYDISTIDETNINGILSIDAINYERVTIKKINGEIYTTIIGKGRWSNLTASGTKSEIRIGDTVTTLSNGANPPVLATGMTAIKWNSGTSTWDTVANPNTDTSWYSYDTTNKQWANAKTADGSMWVWVPRFIYKVSTNWHSNTTGTIDIQFSKGIDDNWNKASIGAINLGETANASNATTNGNKYTNHPAFTFGDTELTGIWVAKFEPTRADGVATGYTADGSCNPADNDSSKAVKIVPGVQSWRCIFIGNAFAVSRNMETNDDYGWGNSGSGIDTHLMKNIEWGAVAYLSKSSYGQGATEITINSDANYYTGGGSGTAYTTNVSQSTTGNIYGIYDLSGNSWERVSAYVNNGHSNLNNYGSLIINVDSKYKDVYQVGSTDDQAANYDLASSQKGDAIWEISNNINGAYSWFDDYSYMPNTSSPWLVRGGFFNNGILSGAFSFYYTNGYTNSSRGFRPVLLVEIGL